MSNEEISEAGAALLCQPSPACAAKIGERLSRGKRVCKWGDEVACATMQGDGYRRRHDGLKLHLRRLLVWSGIPVTCEVFNLFASCIPQEGLNRLERGRKRQGLVPDFMVPAEEGGGNVLCKVKCVSASNTWYPILRQPREADGLTQAYSSTARKTDWNYCEYLTGESARGVVPPELY